MEDNGDIRLGSHPCMVDTGNGDLGVINAEVKKETTRMGDQFTKGSLVRRLKSCGEGDHLYAKIHVPCHKIESLLGKVLAPPSSPC